MLVPGSLAIISASFSEERRGRAIGTWSGFTAITAAIGPVVGGWLIEHVSWRAAFLINVPLALVVLIISFWRVPESRDEATKKELDWMGSLLATIGLGAIVYGLIESSRLGFGNRAVIGALAGGAVTFAAFFFLEARSRNPMLPLSLFQSKNFSGDRTITRCSVPISKKQTRRWSRPLPTASARCSSQWPPARARPSRWSIRSTGS